MRKILVIALAAIAAALTVTGCAAGGYGNDDYGGSPYVIGRYTCASPATGQPDYCVEYSDGSSALVPYSIYSVVPYGDELAYSGGWLMTATPWTRRGVVTDVYHVHYRAHVLGTVGVYTGMSYRSHGRVAYSVYNAVPRRSHHSSYRGRF